MEVIVFERDAYWKMQRELMKMFHDALKEATQQPNDWISAKEAMELLGYKSKTTLRELKDHDEIKFSQLSPRKIKYSKQSILAYLKRKVPKY